MADPIDPQREVSKVLPDRCPACSFTFEVVLGVVDTQKMVAHFLAHLVMGQGSRTSSDW